MSHVRDYFRRAVVVRWFGENACQAPRSREIRFRLKSRSAYSVPKKFEDVQKESVTASRATTVDGEAQAIQAPAPRARKKASRKTGAKKSTSSRKQSAIKSRRRSKPPSEDEIRLRAYFVAEKRAQLSLPGDTHSDWIEAKRQLFEEAGIPLS